MKIAIHQPEFFPWLGFFDKMARAEKYIIFDHVQFKKRYFENRNQLKLNEEAVWITLPVKTKGRYNQQIKEVEISHDSKWQKKIFGRLQHCAAPTPWGAQTVESLEHTVVGKEYNKLIDFNLSIIEWFRGQFGIDTPMERSSDLGVEHLTSSDLILQICKKVEAKTYLCGDSGKEYLTVSEFEANDVEIEWQSFDHPRYEQPGDTFIPYLSALDFVFNYGPHSKEKFNDLIRTKNERG